MAASRGKLLGNLAVKISNGQKPSGHCANMARIFAGYLTGLTDIERVSMGIERVSAGIERIWCEH